jgi:hypothetical protein
MNKLSEGNVNKFIFKGIKENALWDLIKWILQNVVPLGLLQIWWSQLGISTLWILTVFAFFIWWGWHRIKLFYSFLNKIKKISEYSSTLAGVRKNKSNIMNEKKRIIEHQFDDCDTQEIVELQNYVLQFCAKRIKRTSNAGEFPI